VNITCSGELNPRSLRWSPQNAADLRTKSAFHSSSGWMSRLLPRTRLLRLLNVPETRNSWICYHFTEQQVRLTHYAILSRSNENWGDGGFMSSWLVEVSRDGASWIEVDRRERNADLHGPDRARSYEVQRAEVARFVRLVNIGRNSRGDDAMIISGFEIFGSLLED